MENKTAQFNSRIRSYALRGGRITAGQKRALLNLNSKYALELKTAPKWSTVFGRDAPLCLEIGGGYGEAAAHFARAIPEHNYIVAEVYPPGVGAMFCKLAAAELQNVRVIRADARTVLESFFADGALHCARIFFTAPWPKKRHHKRRLIDADFVLLLAQKTKRGGFAHIATDSKDYAAQIRECFAASSHFKLASAKDYPPRPQTKYAVRAKQKAEDLIYARIAN